MDKSLRTALIVLLFTVGVCLLAYPWFSNWLEEQSRASVMDNYREVVAQASKQDLSAEMEKALLYEEHLRSGTARVIDPFDPSSVQATDEEYEACLNLAGNGVMGEIHIPSINVALPIYHGTSDEGLQKGAGHLQGTSLPIGGVSTHCVLAGHTGLPTTRIFDLLDQVEMGDVFTLSVLGETLAYRVCDIQVVLPDESDSLSIQEGRDLVTLVTCTPYGKNTHRLLVTGERCELPDEGVSTAGGSAWHPSVQDLSLIAAILVLAAGSALGALSLRRRRRRRRFVFAYKERR